MTDTLEHLLGDIAKDLESTDPTRRGEAFWQAAMLFAAFAFETLPAAQNCLRGALDFGDEHFKCIYVNRSGDRMLQRLHCHRMLDELDAAESAS